MVKVKESDILRTEDGLELVLNLPDKEEIRWSLTLKGAIAVWDHWWRVMSEHYLELPADKGMPILFRTDYFQVVTEARPNGLVMLMLQPRDMAGLAFSFEPERARKLADDLRRLADETEKEHATHH
jgi:hypothetical protein